MQTGPWPSLFSFSYIAPSTGGLKPLGTMQKKQAGNEKKRERVRGGVFRKEGIEAAKVVLCFLFIPCLSFAGREGGEARISHVCVCVRAFFLSTDGPFLFFPHMRSRYCQHSSPQMLFLAGEGWVRWASLRSEGKCLLY